jgi:NTP pyrophosphatase (non-canonical NTP hydrolase)
MLDFDRLRETNAARCGECYHDIEEWSPTDWGCAMGGECGETLNLIKKLRRLTGPTKDSTVDLIQNYDAKELIHDIGRELADVVIYADLLAQRLGLKLGDCVTEKFNETSVKIKSERRL